MRGSTERALEKVIKYGVVFSEVGPPISKRQGVDAYQLNPIAKAVFGVASVTFEVRARHWRIRGKGNACPFSS